MTLGDKIYNLRKTANLSQEEFGSIFNVSRQSVSKWETNQVLPELKTIIDIAKYFNVSLDDLLLDKEGTQKENTSFENIFQMKMKFNFGCIVLFIGIVLLVVSLFLHGSVIAYYGSLLEYFYMSLRGGEIFNLLSFTILFIIIGIGIYIIKESFNKK